MKKIKSFAIFIFILCFVFCNKEIFAETSGNWEYYIENNLAIIVGYSGNDSNVTIPSNLDGYVVNQIGYESVEEQAYYVPFERNENIETVTIPDTVKKIEKATFYYCPNLKTVNIPNSVKEIDSEFVYGTKNVNYTIPSNLTLLEDGVYREVAEITTLDGTCMYDMEYEILNLVNEERAKVGVSPLSYDAQLCEDANLRAAEVALHYSHTRPSGAGFYTAITNPCDYAGENIAAGYPTAQKVMEAWMSSEGHRENILYADYKSIGIGVYKINGTTYFSQIFTTEDKINEFSKRGEEKVNYTYPVSTYDGKLDNVEINTFPSTLNLQKDEEYEIDSVYLFNKEVYNLKIPVTLNSIKWQTSNSSIVTIDENGKMKGIKGGASNITASIGNYSKLCTVLVDIPLEKIEIIGKKELDISNEEDLNAVYTVKYYPEDTTSPRKINWIVDNPDILSIDENGKVTLYKAGKTSIVALTMDGKDARYDVEVVKHIIGISVENEEITMYADETKSINAVVLPEDTTDDKTLTYSSSNNNVADVDNGGKIKAKNVGTTFIDINTSNGKFKRCKVNVIKRNIEDVNISNIYPRVYTGNAIEPDIYATINDKKLIKNQDYKLSYEGNIEIGQAQITVEGIGNYEGEKILYFDITSYLKGDVNEDTFINSTDAALVLDFFKNGTTIQKNYDVGDMNEDNMLNSIDASLILDIFKNGIK